MQLNLVEEMLAQAFPEEDESVRDFKLEARGESFDKACNELILKWNRELLVDCNTPEQFILFRAMVLVLQQMRLKLLGEMKGER